MQYYRPIRILLIEDCLSHAVFFDAALQSTLQLKHDLTVASSLTEGFQKLSQENFDITVLDLGLPESQGMETIDLFFEKMGKDMPVIVLTAMEEERIGEEALRKGVLDFLKKGYYNADQLARTVRYGLERWRQRAELNKAQEDLKSFAHAAAHDLKSPVKSIGSYATILKASLPENSLDADSLEFIEYIISFADQAERLVDGLLNFSVLGNKVVNATETDLSGVAKQAATNLTANIKECDASIDIGRLPEAIADEDLLVHVFQNLIGNGIKYCGENKPKILIEAEQTKSEVIVSVTDNGRGIDERHRKNIFKPFKRLNYGKEEEGFGLGLAICQRIVEAHHGRIWVEVGPDGNGSTFRFSLPVAVAKAPSKPDALHQQA